jgi:hypothetical protein
VHGLPTHDRRLIADDHPNPVHRRNSVAPFFSVVKGAKSAEHFSKFFRLSVALRPPAPARGEEKLLSPLEQLLAKPSSRAGPAVIVMVTDRLAHWQTGAKLVSIRDEKALAQLLSAEQTEWRTLWDEVRAVAKQARACFTETSRSGDLTAPQKAQVHEVQLTAARTYVIDMTSQAFDPLLQPEDGNGKKLAANGDVEPGKNLNSRLIFTPPQTGTYRLVANSSAQRGTGAYTQLIREFTAQRKK